MSQKLGLHVQSWAPGTLMSAFRANGGILKVMAPDAAPVRDVLEKQPDTVIVCRKYFSDDEQRRRLAAGYMGGHETADDVYHTFFEVFRVANQFGAPIYFEGLNEIGLWNDADQYNDFTVGFADRCMEGGTKPAVYSFATGNPPGYKDGSPDDLRAYWAHYLDGLYAAQKAGGALALHEYDAPDMRRLEGWLCLRYRRVYDILPDDLKSLPLFLTEIGIDGGVIGAGSAAAAGWRNYATAEAYGEQLRWYAGELAKDAHVLGATVFTAGNQDMWGSFDVTGVGPVLDAIAADVPQGETVMPKKTTIAALNVPSGQPGGSVVLSIRASGIDGQAAGFADVALPPVPGTVETVYGPNLTTKIGPFSDGDVDLTVQLPEVTTPLPGPVTATVTLRLVEIDGQTFDGGISDPFDVIVTPAQAQTPSNGQGATQPGQPGNPSADWEKSPNLGAMTAFYDAAHALEGNADPKVAEIAAAGVALVDYWKGGPNPFAKTQEKPKK